MGDILGGWNGMAAKWDEKQKSWMETGELKESGCLKYESAR